MLTRQGALVTAASFALVVCGRLFGIFELFLLGAGGAALVVGAAVVVGLTRVHLNVARELRPARVHAGIPATVELRIHNRGERRTPLLQLRDAVGGFSRTASVVLAPLAPGQTVAAGYSLPTEGRGILSIGPLELRIADPFGLTSLSTPGAPVTELTVWPAVERVLAPPHSSGQDHDASRGGTLSVSSDEFYALRSYADGDDMRRVHWRASAKRDELVVRQDEQPWQGQTTVVLDARTATYRENTFERAVSAAASIVEACHRQGVLVRLVTTASFDSGFGSGRGHIDTIMEHLAVVELRPLGHLATLVSTVARPGSGNGGPLVVLTGDGAESTHLPAGGRSRQAGPSWPTTVVTFVTAIGRGPSTGGRRSVEVDDATSFAAAWNRALAASQPAMAP